jgi:hypothetical protein
MKPSPNLHQGEEHLQTGITIEFALEKDPAVYSTGAEIQQPSNPLAHHHQTNTQQGQDRCEVFYGYNSAQWIQASQN